jgi:hypothetical protein
VPDDGSFNVDHVAILRRRRRSLLLRTGGRVTRTIDTGDDEIECDTNDLDDLKEL